ncbi:MAG: PKD domain-containing protein [Solirubrobacteraceae bacterium]|nr:PKD domain-containing protein [Solirubrobacteraceae bacterium]
MFPRARIACGSLAVLAAPLLCSGSALAAPPVVSIQVVPSLPVAGQVIELRAIASDPDGDAVTFAWDIDEDGVVDSTQPTATFSQPFAGVRTVRVTVSDGTDTATASQVVRVNAFPFAAFAATPVSPVVGETVTLTSSSQDPDGTIADADQLWDLDADGVYGDAVGPVAQRAFGAPGVFTVSLRVRDAGGVASFAFRDVPVFAAPVPAPTPVAGASTPAPVATPVAAPKRLTVIRPFPVLRVAGTFNRRGARFSRVTVEAPAAARVRVTCSGRGCRFKRLSLPPGRIRALERGRLRRGARVTISVTQPGFIGKYTSIVVRRGKPPRRIDRCLKPTSTKPSACPAI